MVSVRGLTIRCRRDVPAVLAVLSPDISWTEAEGFPYGGTYVGHDAILQNVFARLGDEWDGYAAVPHEFIASADTVVNAPANTPASGNSRTTMS